MTAEASTDAEDVATVARWVRELTPGQTIICDIDHDVPGGWCAWVLMENGEDIAMVEPSSDGFSAISDWLDAEEEAGRLLPIACGTYVHPLHELAVACLTTMH